MAAQNDSKTLFGGSRPWSSADWTSSDDRVRGGSSQSYIDTSSSTAIFYGNLDTNTLGGAGFASLRTTSDSTWDLSNYDGILLDIKKIDGKKYTLILKDEILPKSPNGREQSTVSWEYDFAQEQLLQDLRGKGGEVFIPWDDLVPTYRGREKKDVPPLNLKEIKRFSLMMRSFFDTQSGPFSISVTSISASKRSAISRSPRRQEDLSNEKLPSSEMAENGGNGSPRISWSRWLSGGCFGF